MVVVDVANVIGSRPDGWWRDRAAAATRLRDELAASVAAGHPIGDLSPVELVLVVEGKAGGVGSVPGVEVISAPGSGDDAIVDVVRSRGPDRPVVVVTADRELRGRVAALGAVAHGPRWLRR
ncbi:hypothetical protein [Asanoa hainanensis]|uniref:hypothetical protein n=1 Tax=Asanoa hainanensis TaxID=560556 RepID=UPI001FE8C6BA|nr:hypothetical protein [Asanoa hainanensis]